VLHGCLGKVNDQDAYMVDVKNYTSSLVKRETMLGTKKLLEIVHTAVYATVQNMMIRPFLTGRTSHKK